MLGFLLGLISGLWLVVDEGEGEGLGARVELGLG